MLPTPLLSPSSCRRSWLFIPWLGCEHTRIPWWSWSSPPSLVYVAAQPKQQRNTIQYNTTQHSTTQPKQKQSSTLSPPPSAHIPLCARTERGVCFTILPSATFLFPVLSQLMLVHICDIALLTTMEGGLCVYDINLLFH